MELHGLTQEQATKLHEAVEWTKKGSYTYTTPAIHEPLLAHNLVEINSEITTGHAVATRATAEGMRYSVLLKWEESKETLAAAKEREMELRKEVVTLFADADKVKGTENVQLEDGCKLKIVKKLNYNLDSDLDKVEAKLDAIEALGPEYKIVADRLVKWKAELSVSEYNKLDELGETGMKIKAAMNEVIEIKEGAPTVDIIEPKNKK